MASIRLLQTKADRETKVRFWHLFADSKGATNRRRLMIYLKNNLANANQLANHFHMDYKGIRFHLRVLEENNLVRNSEHGYNDYYFVAPAFEINEEIFWEINTMMEKEQEKSIIMIH
ncbi:MAG: winged helix-turn-helix domain-containing protein [Candidatus Nitrosotenuis sp.]